MLNWNYTELKNILERVIATDWETLKPKLQYDEVLEDFINEIETSQRKFMASIAGKASSKKRDMRKLGKSGADKRWGKETIDVGDEEHSVIVEIPDTESKEGGE
jgi:hypothetical protein